MLGLINRCVFWCIAATTNDASSAGVLPSAAIINPKALYAKTPHTALTATATPFVSAGGGGGGGGGAGGPTAKVQALVIGLNSSTGSGSGGGGSGGGSGSGMVTTAAAAASNYDKKLKDKHLPLENALKSAAPNDRALSGAAGRERDRLLRASKHRIQTLSSREKRALKLYALPSDDRYATYQPLHQLWLGYITHLCGDDLIRSRTAGCESKLLKADFHGAHLTVIRARDTGLIGLSGIVVHETATTFKIVTPTHGFKSLPKRNAVFTVPLQSLSAGGASATGGGGDSAAAAAAAGSGGSGGSEQVALLSATLHGNQLCLRPADRIAKKFKVKTSIELK